MMQEIVLPAGTVHVKFEDLAHLIAIALHPVDDANDPDSIIYGLARVNLDAELALAVKSGELQVKDPLTFGPHTFPFGAALDGAAVMVEDLNEYVAGRGIAVTFTPKFPICLQPGAQDKAKQDAGRYTLEEAARLLERETGERAGDMQNKLMLAARSGALPVYEPGKAARYAYGDSFASRAREFYEEAHWDDLNTWLAGNEPRLAFTFPAPPGAKQIKLEPKKAAELDPFHEFKAMPDLKWSEIQLSIIGAKDDAGLCASNTIRTTARKTTRNISLSAFGLDDGRTGMGSEQSLVLWKMAFLPSVPKDDETTSVRVSRLRKLLRERFGIQTDPFSYHDNEKAWAPRFVIRDGRDAMVARLKAESERKQTSYNDNLGWRTNVSDDGEYSFEDEDDAGGQYITNRGHGPDN